MSDDIPATIKQWQETLATSFSLLRTDAAKQLLANVEQALLGKDAEIDRLRAEVEQQGQRRQFWVAKCAEADGEIARLSAEVATLRADLAMAREREGMTGLEYRGGWMPKRSEE